MDLAVALIAFGILATLIAPNLLTREILLALIVIGALSVWMPNLVSTQQGLALIAFSILFFLVIPPLLK